MAWSVKKWTNNVNQFFNIQDGDGTAKNVSGYTVRINAKQGTTTLFSGVCTTASATTGFVYYTVQSGDFPSAGKAEYEIVLELGVEVNPTEIYPIHIGRRL